MTRLVSPFLAPSATTALTRAANAAPTVAQRARMAYTPLHSGKSAGVFVWTDRKLYPGWIVSGHAKRVDATLVISSLTVKSVDEEKGVTTEVFRRLPLGIVRSDLRAHARQTDLIDQARAQFPGVTQVPARAVPGDPRGRPRLSEDLLQLTAGIYLEEQKHGRGVVQRVWTRLRETLGRKVAPRTISTCKSWIRAAEREGWLTGLEHGRAGADPGPRWRSS